MDEVVARERTRSTALERIMAEIDALGLTANLIELETQGYTTLPSILAADQVTRARAAIVQRVERATAATVDVEAEAGEGLRGMNYVPYLLYDDEIFEDILMEPKPLALITWLLGESRLLSSMGCHFRRPGGAPLMLHSDNGNGIPAPFGPTSVVANINYALTPYSREAGALAMVPGSHKLQRQPTPAENFGLHGLTAAQTMARVRAGGPFDDLDWTDPPGIVPMDLAPGDAVIWHGNTWHGSFRRTLPGVRLNLAVYFNRQYIQTQERHDGPATKALLARHGEDQRFRTLLGAKQPYGWRDQGPDYALMARSPKGLYD